MSEERALEIPVYLFTGFLESGKTKVIQETMEDQTFNTGEETLILLCEEGIEEYDISSFAFQNVTLKILSDISELNENYLSQITNDVQPERIIIEYNGMWQLDQLYNALPKNWMIYQELFLMDSTTAQIYNTNMRSLVVDKLQSSEMVVFNRCTSATDRLLLHKLVRGVSRSANIAYEMADGTVEYDDIVDPLPFDVHADIIKIEDRDFAIWYRDLCEEPDKYIGKTLSFKGLVGRDDSLGDHSFILGRHIMICCQDDIAYRGIVCFDNKKVKLETKDWIVLTAQLQMEYHPIYRFEGPVLHVLHYYQADMPEEPVATFY